ncbi:hypothetical protein [Dyadobacter sp. CY351]|uniref:hypothetical protein n=1 Tax=Dyadobacter sp. CY351 TaxID=2909337 RepID=UPI001F441EF9|nr:hypothetical protein [Dyadobacter sp. CY351]MCF2518378.1 hypothetical protein [Dyadobacter sp. CY351]
MARNREPQIFNISFLDVICGALGAVIFLFIAVPKGGSPPSYKQQLAVSYDTLHRQLFAPVDDSLRHKRPGDTLLVILADYKELPSAKDCPDCPECETSAPAETRRVSVAPNEDHAYITPEKKELEPPKPEELKNTQYLGDPPGVPCKVSFEISWADIGDNVDLFVCKGAKCVSGRAREIRDIGQWDSGKAKTKFFGSDLRTTQEAVRQFDKVIPGEYKVYAVFKASAKNSASVALRGLVYSKNENGQEQGEPFTSTLQLNAERLLLATVTLAENGEFKLVKN